jgi:pilus assembly protein Flp/PilA
VQAAVCRKGVNNVKLGANKPRDKTRRRLRSLLRAKGQGLVEYAMIIVMIAIVILAILTFIGQQVFTGLYSKISSGFPAP